MTGRKTIAMEPWMPITFQCPKCSKKLRAPESAVGKSSACPGCGHMVACPEPVYDAEVVESSEDRQKPPGFNPVADVDDDKPYGLADPPPLPAASSTESRRPCPMCGEMIVTTAAKCRFCGEVFDSTLKQAIGKGKSKRYRAEDEEIGPAEIALAILCTWIALAVGIVWMSQGKPKGIKLLKVVALVIGVSCIIGVIIGVLQVAMEQPGVR